MTDQDFIERLHDLKLLAQNHETADIFNDEYGKMINEIMGLLGSLRALAVLQVGWLENEKQLAGERKGIEQ